MFIKWDAWCRQLRVITNYVCLYILIFICLVIHLIIYVFAFFRWIVSSCKPYLYHTLLIILCKSMFESFSFRPWALDLLPVKCPYVMADCSFSLALCTENKCFSTIYYVLVGYKILWIPLSDTGISMVKMKPEGYLLIIKLLLSLWLLYKNYINYYYYIYVGGGFPLAVQLIIYTYSFSHPPPTIHHTTHHTLHTT